MRSTIGPSFFINRKNHSKRRDHTYSWGLSCSLFLDLGFSRHDSLSNGGPKSTRKINKTTKKRKKRDRKRKKKIREIARNQTFNFDLDFVVGAQFSKPCQWIGKRRRKKKKGILLSNVFCSLFQQNHFLHLFGTRAQLKSATTLLAACRGDFLQFCDGRGFQ